MGKFKKKPIIVEAFQYLQNVTPPPPGIKWDDELHTYMCETHNGAVQVNDRDWIIKDVKDGLFYPCADEVFLTLFDEVVDNLVGPEDIKEVFPTEQKCPKCNNQNFLFSNRKNQKWCPACRYGMKP